MQLCGQLLVQQHRSQSEPIFPEQNESQWIQQKSNQSKKGNR
jgi:hypothetical protein